MATHQDAPMLSVEFDRFAAIADAADPERALDDALSFLVDTTGLPGFVARDVGGRLRVVRFRGVDSDRLRAVLTDDGFLSAVATWRERPVPDRRTGVVPVVGGQTLVAGALVVDGWEGFVALLAPGDPADPIRQLTAGVARQASAALRSSLARSRLDHRDYELDVVLHTLPDAALVVDDEECLVRVNGAACELFGLSGSFDTGRPARDRLGSPELEALLFDAGAPGEIDIELGTPRRNFRAVVGHARVADDGVRRILVLVDQSAERESRQVKEDFVAVMGHELRTPLTLVRGFVETVLAHGDRLSEPERQDFLAKAAAQAGRLQELIDDLLVMSTGSSLGLDPSEQDVAVLASEVVETLMPRYPDRAVESVGLGGNTTAVADGRRLSQVIRHLVDNALKYSDGPVQVEVRGVSAGIEVAVVDQGPGIFSGDLATVFEPFHQLDGSSTRRQGGTGTGLHLARRIVERMGGRLDVDSRLGQGSRFWFVLPRVPHGVATEAAMAGSDPSSEA